MKTHWLYHRQKTPVKMFSGKKLYAIGPWTPDVTTCQLPRIGTNSRRANKGRPNPWPCSHRPTSFDHYSRQCGTSDHNPVLVKLNVPVFRDKPYRRKYGSMTKQTTGKWEDIFPLLTVPSIPWERPREGVQQNYWNHQCCHGPAHSKQNITKKTGDKVWFTDKCRRASRKKRKIFRQLRKKNNSANKEKFQKARQTDSKVEKEAKRKYNTKLKEDLTNSNLSCKKWWRVVNSLAIARKAAHSIVSQLLFMMMLPISQPEKRPTYFARHSQRSAIFRMQTLLPHILLINQQFHLLTTSSSSLRLSKVCWINWYLTKLNKIISFEITSTELAPKYIQLF